MHQYLRRMYAFALWDAAKQALLLLRAPFGIMPLCYTPTITSPFNFIAYQVRSFRAKLPCPRSVLKR